MISIEQAINRAHDLVESAERALEAGEIDEAEWHRRLSAITTEKYLAADNPRAQSGHSGDEAHWTQARSLIVDGIDGNGTFLDVGCASGYLMECVQRWCAAQGLRVEPYGLEISQQLAELARSRLPAWSDRILVGNAMGWQPPVRFDFVRTGLYVPWRRERDFVAHLLHHVVAPSGRLIIGVHNEAVERNPDSPTIEQRVASWGYAIAGRSEREHRDPRIRYRAFWIDRPNE